MSSTIAATPPSEKNKQTFIERVGKKIPDPVIIFMWLFAITMVASGLMGGTLLK